MRQADQAVLVDIYDPAADLWHELDVAGPHLRAVDAEIRAFNELLHYHPVGELLGQHESGAYLRFGCEIYAYRLALVAVEGLEHNRPA